MVGVGVGSRSNRKFLICVGKWPNKRPTLVSIKLPSSSVLLFLYLSLSLCLCLSLSRAKDDEVHEAATAAAAAAQLQNAFKLLVFVFFLLFFHLFCFCFGRWQRCVFSPTRMQLLAAAPSPRRLSSPYFSLRLALLQRIVDRATRTSSNQICFMTTATTQNDAQTHTHTHTQMSCACVCDARSQA